MNLNQYIQFPKDNTYLNICFIYYFTVSNTITKFI